VSLSSDGKQILTGSADTTAILWDGETGKPVRTFTGHTREITTVTLSGDGKRMLSGSDDQTAILWDAQTGKPIQTFTGHTHWITSVSLSSDGKRVITGSWDGTTRLWDARTGAELCRLISLDGGDEWLVVTPDGLFDGSSDAPRRLSYRVTGTLDFVSMDHFQHRYYTPGLLTRLMRGERPRAKVDIARALPPKVRLMMPAAAPRVNNGKLRVTAVAESRGTFPVTTFRLLLNGRPYGGRKGIVAVAKTGWRNAKATWDVELEPGSHTIKVLVDTDLVRGVASDEVEVRSGRVEK
jgi:hypothetical protein